MQVFKAFFKITKHYFGSILIYFVIFFAICMISTKSGQDSTPSSFETKKVDLAIIDRDQTSDSNALTAYLSRLHNKKNIPDTTESLQNELYYRNIEYILIIPKGYAKKIAAGNFEHLTEYATIPSSFSAIYLDSQIDHYFKTLKTYLAAGYDLPNAETSTCASLQQTAKISILSHIGSYKANNNFLRFYQYFTYVFLCILLTSLGPILLSFRNKDLSQRIEASPSSLKVRNLSLVGCSCLLSLVYWGVFVAASAIIYRHEFFSILGVLCIINSFLYMMICAAITFLVSNLASSVNLFSIMANVLGLGMSFLCGVFVPAQYMSKGVLNAARVLPTYWYMDALNQFADYASTGHGVSTMITGFVIEVIFFLIILCMGFVLTKVKRTHA